MNTQQQKVATSSITGARRFRASRIAGKDTIPAFIDNDYSEADQVIENLQRNELTAREIADFIGRELAKGKKKSEIAREIGKSPAFVTQHVVLLDLPDPIAETFNTGRANDVTVINEVVKDYKKNPEEVHLWLADESQELTRGAVTLLHEFLEDKRSHDIGENNDDSTTIDEPLKKTDTEASGSKQEQKSSDTKKVEKIEVEGKAGPWGSECLSQNDAGSGAYVLDKYSPGGGWTAKRFKDHWMGWQGEPVDEIEFRTIHETAARRHGPSEGRYLGMRRIPSGGSTGKTGKRSQCHGLR